MIGFYRLVKYEKKKHFYGSSGNNQELKRGSEQKIHKN